MEDQNTTYDYLENFNEDSPSQQILTFLQQFTQPSQFYKVIQSIVENEKKIFEALSSNEKTGNTYHRRIKELAALEKMLLDSANKSTSLICAALKIKQEPLTYEDCQFPLPPSIDFDSSTSTSDGYYEITRITHFINMPGVKTEKRKCFADDTDLYDLCRQIVENTETPWSHTLDGQNRLIDKIKKILESVDNQSIVIHENRKKIEELKDHLIFGASSADNPNKKEARKELFEIPLNSTSDSESDASFSIQNTNPREDTHLLTKKNNEGYFENNKGKIFAASSVIASIIIFLTWYLRNQKNPFTPIVPPSPEPTPTPTPDAPITPVTPTPTPDAPISPITPTPTGTPTPTPSPTPTPFTPIVPAPAGCVNPVSPLQYSVSTTILANNNIQFEIVLNNTGDETWNIGQLSFDSNAKDFPYVEGFPRFTTMQHVGNTYTFILRSPFQIPAHSTISVKVSTPVSSASNYAAGIVTVPTNLATSFQNIPQTVLYTDKNICDKSPAPGTFEVEVTSTDAITPQTIDPFVNALGIYLGVDLSSGAVIGKGTASDSLLLANTQTYEEQRPHTGLVLNIGNVDVIRLISNPSQLSNFLSTLKAAITVTNAKGFTIKPVYPKAIDADYEQALVKLQKTLNTSMGSSDVLIQLETPFNQAFSNITKQALLENVDYFVMPEYELSATIVGTPLAAINKPISEQNTTDFPEDRVIKKIIPTLQCVPVKDPIDPQHPLNNTASGENSTNYPACAIKNECPSISSPPLDYQHIESAGNSQDDSNSIFFNKNTSKPYVCTGTQNSENLGRLIKSGDSVSIPNYHNNGPIDGTNETFVHAAGNIILGNQNSSTNSSSFFKPAGLLAGGTGVAAAASNPLIIPIVLTIGTLTASLILAGYIIHKCRASDPIDEVDETTKIYNP